MPRRSINISKGGILGDSAKSSKILLPSGRYLNLPPGRFKFTVAFVNQKRGLLLQNTGEKSNKRLFVPLVENDDPTSSPIEDEGDAEKLIEKNISGIEDQSNVTDAFMKTNPDSSETTSEFDENISDEHIDNDSESELISSDFDSDIRETISIDDSDSNHEVSEDITEDTSEYVDNAFVSNLAGTHRNAFEERISMPHSMIEQGENYVDSVDDNDNTEEPQCIESDLVSDVVVTHDGMDEVVERITMPRSFMIQETTDDDQPVPVVCYKNVNQLSQICLHPNKNDDMFSPMLTDKMVMKPQTSSEISDCASVILSKLASLSRNDSTAVGNTVQNQPDVSNCTPSSTTSNIIHVNLFSTNIDSSRPSILSNKPNLPSSMTSILSPKPRQLPQHIKPVANVSPYVRLNPGKSVLPDIIRPSIILGAQARDTSNIDIVRNQNTTANIPQNQPYVVIPMGGGGQNTSKTILIPLEVYNNIRKSSNPPLTTSVSGNRESPSMTALRPIATPTIQPSTRHGTTLKPTHAFISPLAKNNAQTPYMCQNVQYVNIVAPTKPIPPSYVHFKTTPPISKPTSSIPFAKSRSSMISETKSAPSVLSEGAKSEANLRVNFGLASGAKSWTSPSGRKYTHIPAMKSPSSVVSTLPTKPIVSVVPVDSETQTTEFVSPTPLNIKIIDVSSLQSPPSTMSRYVSGQNSLQPSATSTIQHNETTRAETTSVLSAECIAAKSSPYSQSRLSSVSSSYSKCDVAQDCSAWLAFRSDQPLNEKQAASNIPLALPAYYQPSYEKQAASDLPLAPPRPHVYHRLLNEKQAASNSPSALPAFHRILNEKQAASNLPLPPPVYASNSPLAASVCHRLLNEKQAATNLTLAPPASHQPLHGKPSVGSPPLKSSTRIHGGNVITLPAAHTTSESDVSAFSVKPTNSGLSQPISSVVVSEQPSRTQATDMDLSFTYKYQEVTSFPPKLPTFSYKPKVDADTAVPSRATTKQNAGANVLTNTQLIDMLLRDLENAKRESTIQISTKMKISVSADKKSDVQSTKVDLDNVLLNELSMMDTSETVEHNSEWVQSQMEGAFRAVDCGSHNSSMCTQTENDVVMDQSCTNDEPPILQRELSVSRFISPHRLSSHNMPVLEPEVLPSSQEQLPDADTKTQVHDTAGSPRDKIDKITQPTRNSYRKPRWVGNRGKTNANIQHFSAHPAFLPPIENGCVMKTNAYVVLERSELYTKPINVRKIRKMKRRKTCNFMCRTAALRLLCHKKNLYPVSYESKIGVKRTASSESDPPHRVKCKKEVCMRQETDEVHFSNKTQNIPDNVESKDECLNALVSNKGNYVPVNKPEAENTDEYRQNELSTFYTIKSKLKSLLIPSLQNPAYPRSYIYGDGSVNIDVIPSPRLYALLSYHCSVLKTDCAKKICMMSANVVTKVFGSKLKGTGPFTMKTHKMIAKPGVTKIVNVKETTFVSSPIVCQVVKQKNRISIVPTHSSTLELLTSKNNDEKQYNTPPTQSVENNNKTSRQQKRTDKFVPLCDYAVLGSAFSIPDGEENTLKKHVNVRVPDPTIHKSTFYSKNDVGNPQQMNTDKIDETVLDSSIDINTSNEVNSKVSEPDKPFDLVYPVSSVDNLNLISNLVSTIDEEANSFVTGSETDSCNEENDKQNIRNPDKNSESVDELIMTASNCPDNLGDSHKVTFEQENIEEAIDDCKMKKYKPTQKYNSPVNLNLGEHVSEQTMSQLVDDGTCFMISKQQDISDSSNNPVSAGSASAFDEISDNIKEKTQLREVHELCGILKQQEDELTELRNLMKSRKLNLDDFDI